MLPLTQFSIPPTLPYNPAHPTSLQLLCTSTSPHFRSLLSFSLTRTNRIVHLLNTSSQLLALHNLLIHTHQHSSHVRICRLTTSVTRRRANLSELQSRDVALLVRRGEATTATERRYDRESQDIQSELTASKATMNKEEAVLSIVAAISSIRRDRLIAGFLGFCDLKGPKNFSIRQTGITAFETFVYSDHRELLNRLKDQSDRQRKDSERQSEYFELKKAGLRLLLRCLISVDVRGMYAALTAIQSLKN
jgi:hypothetical protein